MQFDSSPEAMTANGQIWFPADHYRIRWWAKFGQAVIVRPSLPADASSSLGLDGDAFWTWVAHMGREEGNMVYADWLVSRPDLGISVMASKEEVAVSSYYERLLDTAIGSQEGTLGSVMGVEASRRLKAQFSPMSPSFAILSDTGKAPIVFDMDDCLRSEIARADNVLPMKRSVYDPRWRERRQSRSRRIRLGGGGSSPSVSGFRNPSS